MDGTPPPDIRQRARAMFEQILATHEPLPLDADVERELERIVERAREED